MNHRSLALSFLFAFPANFAVDAHAQVQTQSAEFRLTPDEELAVQTLDKEKFIEARERAQKILEKDSSSIAAMYVLASVHCEIEGNLARALFLIRSARREFAARFGEPPTESHARFWCRMILIKEEQICALMDRREEQLTVLKQLFDYFHDSAFEAEQIWPLLKLGQFKIARELGQRLIFDSDFEVRLTAYNSLIAVEDEARDRKAGYDISAAAYRMVGEDSCVISMNYALAAMQWYQIEQATELNQKAFRATRADCSSNPHRQGSMVYLVQGEYQRALSSLLELRKKPERASRRVQNEMTVRGHTVELLFAMGQVEEALMRVEPISDRTDRTGNTSASTENYILHDLILHWVVGETNLRWQEELRSARGFFDASKMRLLALEKEAKQKELIHRALPYSLSNSLLIDIARAYYTDVRPWYFGDLVNFFGEALFEQIITEARAKEKYELEAGLAYYDGYLAELRFKQGKFTEARELCEKALKNLPKLEKLFRLRLTAMYAEILRNQDSEMSALRFYEQVIEGFPAIFRVLDLRLPVEIYSDGAPISKRVAELLRKSPRLQPGEGSLALRVSQSGDTARCCLHGSHGRRLVCTELDETSEEAKTLVKEKNFEKQAIAAVDAFHKQAFSPLVEMTSENLNSLDGRAGKVSADLVLKNLLNDGLSNKESGK